MKCRHCSRNAFRVINGIALCLSCNTDFQNTSNNQVSSALQLRRGIDVADSMLKARVDLQRNQNAEHQINNGRNTEVNNYNTHNNITVHGNNSGILNTGKAQIKNNDIGIANSAKSNRNISLLTNIIANGLKLAALCLQILKRLFW
jgi:hypothetical protein